LWTLQASTGLESEITIVLGSLLEGIVILVDTENVTSIPT
jgi:hypothetical protein